MADGQADLPKLDAETFRARLLVENDWTEGLAIPEGEELFWVENDLTVQVFRAARQAACIARLEAGDWERWAEALLSLRAQIPGDDASSALFAALARADFTKVCFDTHGSKAADSQFTNIKASPPKSYPAVADFQGAQFTGPAGFQGAQFTEWADFQGAQFTGPAGFQGAQFTEWADFQ
ncbi:MAG: pentapeptide repeat-containing protein, partial [Pseudomonadota bacterium]